MIESIFHDETSSGMLLIGFGGPSRRRLESNELSGLRSTRNKLLQSKKIFSFYGEYTSLRD